MGVFQKMKKGIAMSWNPKYESETTPLLEGYQDSMKGDRALHYHPEEITSSFNGSPQARLVHVSGSGPNVFGHTLLCFNVESGYYVHVHRPGKHKPSVICGHDAFINYLADEGKKVIHQIDINDITDRKAAIKKLKSRLVSKYFWGAVTHNCAEFAATIVQAGGSKYTATCWLPNVMTAQDTKSTSDGGGVYSKIH